MGRKTLIMTFLKSTLHIKNYYFCSIFEMEISPHFAETFSDAHFVKVLSLSALIKKDSRVQPVCL
jgi:hypothetical protein